MLNIILDPLVSDKDLEERKGDFIDDNEYIYTVKRDCNLYDSNGSLVFIFRKKRIPLDETRKAFKNLLGISKQKGDNRSIASGPLDLNKLPKYMKKENITKYNKFRVLEYIKQDGTVSKRNFGNMTTSNIVGFYEKRDRNYGSNSPKCRLTSFSAKEVEKWNEVQGFIKSISDLYSELAHKEYTIQLQEANKTEFHIKDTPFSTITVNYNFRTALHKDEGDYKQGLSCFTICQEGEYEGCYLGFPKYKVNIDVREGDILLFNPHEYHCNTSFSSSFPYNKDKLPCPYTRLSFVLYLRNDISKTCSNMSLEESKNMLNEISMLKYNKPYFN